MILNGPFYNACVVPFFFLMLRPPPRSTLFPYTTLFRPRPHRVPRRRDRANALLRHGPHRLLHGRRGRDRKSTRLNSSHPSISYAVFCLKKKKKTHHASFIMWSRRTNVIIRPPSHHTPSG